ncbi:MAG: hypothetical protein WCL51_14435 [Bacteroidota bacterium]
MSNEPNSKLRNGKILSLNTLYGSGTMMNRMNDGFKLREVKGNAGYYESAVTYYNYLFIFDQREWLKGYNGILFTKIISASKPLIEDIDK